MTIKLLSIRRIINAFKFLFSRNGDPLQILNNYQTIYGVDKYESDSLEESFKSSSASAGDVIFLPVIDWHNRYQRPQHFAAGLAERGFRVIYIATSPLLDRESDLYRFIEQVGKNAYLCKLRNSTGHFGNIHDYSMTTDDISVQSRSLISLLNNLSIHNPIWFIQHSFWWPLVHNIGCGRVLYDCMDHHAGFSGDRYGDWVPNEAELVASANIVITSSQYLFEKVNKIRANFIIRNGCDFKKFSNAKSVKSQFRPVVGYLGAISDWFDLDLVIAAALQKPSWDFVFVGATTDFDINAASLVHNIIFVGEVPYQEAPLWVAGFDVAIIPFRLTSLTRSTNPVKVYEYLAAGKPVVGTALPELILLGDKVKIAKDRIDFIMYLEQAMLEKSDDKLIRQRQEWALNHDWSNRINDLCHLLK